MSKTKVLKNPIYESPVFLANIAATEPVVGNQGGTWSSKTFSILQVLLYLTLSTVYRDKEGRKEKIITTVVGQDVPNLKKGAINDFNNVLDIIINSFPEDCRHFFKYTYNSTDKVALFALNGSKIEFSSFKNWQDAKSGKRHFVFINEANGIAWKIAEQLMFRAKIRTFVDYNPDAPFWFHEKFIGKVGTLMIYSNLTHNKFVPEKIKRELLAKARVNPEFKRVYILGKTGAIEGVVFSNVVWVASFPENCKRISYGMDFGFTNDPTTLVKLGVSEGILYMELLIYETGLTSPDIVARLKELNIKRTTRVFADSASPKTIRELNALGWRKIRGAKKGANSIIDGINLIKGYGAFHIVDNMHMKAEQLGYVWEEDKLTGKRINKPVDKNNHGFDAARYAMEGISKSKKGYTIK